MNSITCQHSWEKGKVLFKPIKEKKKLLIVLSLRNVATLYQNIAAGTSLYSCFDLHFLNILVGVHAKK